MHQTITYDPYVSLDHQLYAPAAGWSTLSLQSETLMMTVRWRHADDTGLHRTAGSLNS